jgi:RNA 3'-terminal phosphate cyclase-like protein
MIEAARSVLNRYIPDIYLYSDVYKGEESGKCGRLTPPRIYSELNTLIDPQDMHSPLLPKRRRPHFIVRKRSHGLA